MSKKVRDKFYDKLILKVLKIELDFNKDEVNILKDEKLNILFEKIEQKKQAIFWLLKNDFSFYEYKIGGRISYKNVNADFYDEVANSILSKKINRIFERLLESCKDNGQYISVCMDRKLFINKILDKNVLLEEIKEHISEEVERD